MSENSAIGSNILVGPVNVRCLHNFRPASLNSSPGQNLFHNIWPIFVFFLG